MDVDAEGEASHLFLVRLWVDEGPSGEKKIEGTSAHGKAQHIVSGASIDFASLQSLGTVLLRLAERTSAENPKTE